MQGILTKLRADRQPHKFIKPEMGFPNSDIIPNTVLSKGMPENSVLFRVNSTYQCEKETRATTLT